MILDVLEQSSRTNGQRSQFAAAKFDVLLAGECDIAFCIRFSQLRLASQRSCLVLINSTSKDWKKSTIFSRLPSLNIVEDQNIVKIESHKVYFFSNSYRVELNGRSLLLKKMFGSQQDFVIGLESLLSSKLASIGDLLVLKASHLQNQIENWRVAVERIWLEADSGTERLSEKTIQYLSKPAMMQELCMNYRQVVPSFHRMNEPEPEPVHTTSLRMTTEVIQSDDRDQCKSKILSWLNNNSQVDYQNFSQSWLSNIFLTRASELGLSSLQDYVEYCNQSQEESLLLELRLHTRPPRPKLLKHIIERAPSVLSQLSLENETELRIWVAGCGLGESAYGLGLACQEYANIDTVNKTHLSELIKIFATDISQDNIQKASLGLSFECIPIKHSSRLLLEETKKQAHKAMLKLSGFNHSLIFSHRDIIGTVSYRNLHLVVCQELLGRYQETAQRKILVNLNHALVQGGVLWLDSTEGQIIEKEAEKLGFEPIHPAEGLYRKISFLKSAPLSDKLTKPNPLNQHYAPSLNTLLRHHKRYNRYAENHRVFDRLIEKYMLPGLLFDDQYQLIHVLGDISAYLVPFGKGNFSKDVRDLLRPPLKEMLPALLERLFEQRLNRVFNTMWAPKSDDPDTTLQLHIISEFDEVRGVNVGVILFELEVQPEIEEIGLSMELPSTTNTKLEVPSNISYKSSNVDSLDNQQEVALSLQRMQKKIEDLTQLNLELVQANEQVQVVNERLAQQYALVVSNYEEMHDASKKTEELFDSLPFGLAEIGIDCEFITYNYFFKYFLNNNFSESETKTEQENTCNDLSVFKDKAPQVYEQLMAAIHDYQSITLAFNEEISLHLNTLPNQGFVLIVVTSEKSAVLNDWFRLKEHALQ